MTIGIDAGSLGINDDRLKAGVFQLSFSLIKELSEIDKKNEYILYSFLPISKEIMNCFGSNFRNKVLLPKKFWLTGRVSLELLFNKPDVFLGLGQALPFLHPVKNIVLVYDLAFEYFPSCFSDSCVKLSRQTKFVSDHSYEIITISRSSKRDLKKLYRCEEDKVIVAYPGIDPIFKPQPDREIRRIRNKYNIKDSYFLFVGSLKPIKNIPTIVEGFHKFLIQSKKRFKLVLVGSNYWLDQEINKKIKELHIKNEIINLGYLSKEDLPGIYSGAIIFVSPALYEGFGIPLVESMACGTPVITSNKGSMPEVVGKAGLLVNPRLSEEISDAMVKIITFPYLRKELKQKGIKRSKNFSWNKFAKIVFRSMEN